MALLDGRRGGNPANPRRCPGCGALVSKVAPGGPADEAGLKQSDVIREFDGTPIEDFDDLPRVVAAAPVGKKVDVVVIRDGKRKTLRPVIDVMEQPELKLAKATPPAGVAFVSLSAGDATTCGIAADASVPARKGAATGPTI